MWDYVPTRLLPCRTRGDTIGVGSSRLGSQGVDRVDPSARDRQIKHVLQMGSKWIISERVPDATWRREERRIIIKKRGRLIAIKPSILLTLHRTADLHRDRGARDQLIAIVHPAVLSSNGADRTGKNPRIAVRLSRDRAAIACFPRRNRSYLIRRRSTET